MKLLTINEYNGIKLPQYCIDIGLTLDLLNKFNTDYFNTFQEYENYVKINNLPMNDTSLYKFIRSWLGTSTTLLHYDDNHVWIQTLNWLLKFNHTKQRYIYKGYRFFKNVNNMQLEKQFKIGGTILFDKNVALFDSSDKRNISYNSGTSDLKVAKRFASGWGDTLFEGNDTNVIFQIYNPNGVLGFRIGNLHEHNEEETIFGMGSKYRVINFEVSGEFNNDVLITLNQN